MPTPKRIKLRYNICPPRRILMIFLFVSLANILLTAQSKTYCHYCQKVITGNFLQVDNYSFHPEHFICSLCQQQIKGDYNKKDGKYYHPDCYNKSEGLICSYCGKILEQKFVVSENKKYHDDCYVNYVLPKCSICNLPLRGSYSIDIYGSKYHQEHKQELNQCDCCGRLISQRLTGGGIKYDDGRSICNLCYNSAVFRQEEFKEILNRVSSKLISLGINLNMKNISIAGVDKRFLKDKMRRGSELSQGYCDSQTKQRLINNKLINEESYHLIYILNGIHKIAVESTVAHELMHTWLIDNTSGKHSDRTREGSCNFVSYLYLRSINDQAKNDFIKILEKDPDLVYGGGFKELREKFDDQPVADFLKFLKK